MTGIPRRAHRATSLEHIFGSAHALEQAQQQLTKMLTSRGIYFGEGLLPTYAFAYVTSKDRVKKWAEQAELVIAAADHCAREAVTESVTCDTQSFDNEVSELIFAYPGYERCCVICRPDGIPNGDDLRFVELNCDSPAMMMFLDIVTDCLLQLDAFQTLGQEMRPAKPAADILLETLLECYREYGGKQTPTIAIADWEGQKTRFEHLRLAEHFERAGYPTVVCDPRAFRRVGGELQLLNGQRVHIVYRRALVSEIINRRHELEPLLRAYRDGTVCMVNPLRAYVASAKSLMTHLVERELPPWLKPAAKLVPRTVLMDDPQARKEVMANPERFVLKKSEGHGGKHVLLPGVATESAWREAMEVSRREVWIAQDYLEVPMMAMPVADGDRIAWSDRFYNWNPFVFGGRFAGGLVRTSSTPLINITLGGGLLPTLGK
ncbi:MAG: circularly permuted type 2 ATP-grasp protein [Myxococcota bacterium]|nr:circularly permuted type 2 ATP-grasp protein [Deltaproteobacteria bacterium]MDQ3335006.1 circularly permuted type 2 ATP-grasp protein [Myxococcota bacterium]